MKLMKTYTILLALMLGICLGSFAQQVGRYSMYMQNFYAINPAAAGLEDHLDITLGYRQQWLGFENAPQNYFLSANMPLNKEYRSPAPASLRISDPNLYSADLPQSRTSKSGVGAMVNVNQYGAFKYTQAFGTYAFHLPITSKLNLSFGTNVGINAYTIDRSLINLEMPNDSYYDEVLADARQNSTLLDIDVGFMLYAKRYFFGYSSEQLLGNNVSFGSKVQYGKLLVYHRLLFGKTFVVNRYMRVIPSGFVYFTSRTLLSVEANIRFDYHDQVWWGVSYRHKDAIVPMAGLYINDQLKIGYAFDYCISPLRQYAGAGSHEFMIGFMFGNKRVVF